MTDNAQKTPFGRSLQQFGNTVARVATNILGKSVPASVTSTSGPHVVVNFEMSGALLPGGITMPVIGSRAFRTDHSGEMGYSISADFSLSGVSGLGGGVADLSQRGNLSTSGWTPLSNSSWPAVPSGTTVITGKTNGTLIRDSEAANATIALTATTITLTFGANSIVLDATGITLTSAVIVMKTLPGGPGVSGQLYEQSEFVKVSP